MNHSIKNTTHEEAVRLLNDREVKNIDLYNTIMGLQKQVFNLKNENIGLTLAREHHKLQTERAKYLLLGLKYEVTEGEIVKHLPMNPFSIPAVKHVEKYFGGEDLN